MPRPSTFSLVCGAQVPGDRRSARPTGWSAPPPTLGSSSAEAASRRRRPLTFLPQFCGLWTRRRSFTFILPPIYRLRLEVSSRQNADGCRVPHKQILAFVRLQHELGDADACRVAAVEHDGGRHRLGLLAAAGGVRRHHDVQSRT